MRCQGSIWRWSPFFGICRSSSSGTIRCTMYGAKDVASAAGGAAFSPCQCASIPSPRQETRPMPVIRLSRASDMRQGLHRKGDFGGELFHVGPKVRIGEFDDTEGELRAGDELALVTDLGLGH